jgi:hypothetical protein
MKVPLQRMVFAMVVLALWFAVVPSCGYYFAGEGPGPRPSLRKIAIPVFENATGEPGLESILAAALRREFLLRSHMEVVPLEQAEAVFWGRVKSLGTSDVAHREAEETIETRIHVVLDIRCEDAKDGTILWEDRNMVYFEEYFQDPDAMASFENRRHALEIVARELAVRIHDRFLSRF